MEHYALCSLLHESSNCVHNGRRTVVWIFFRELFQYFRKFFRWWRNRPAAVFASRLFTGASWDASNFHSCGKTKPRQLWTWNVFCANWFRNSPMKKRRRKREKMQLFLQFYWFTPSIFAIELLKINRVACLKISDSIPKSSLSAKVSVCKTTSKITSKMCKKSMVWNHILDQW